MTETTGWRKWRGAWVRPFNVIRGPEGQQHIFHAAGCQTCACGYHIPEVVDSDTGWHLGWNPNLPECPRCFKMVRGQR